MQGAFIGLNMPNGTTATAPLTDSSGNSNYSFTATGEGTQKIQAITRLLGKDSPIELGLCISDVTASMMRLAFARSHRYFRGFKSLSEQTKLLRSSELPFYELALQLSKRKRVKSLIGKIEKLL